MALPTLFANNPTPTGPQLDGDLNALGSLVTVQCTAVGTNSIALTPTANAPTVTAYGAGQPFRFAFAAAATTTGAVTLAVAGLAALPVYMPNGAQATTGNLGIGVYYEVAYVASYNSGNGGWAITSVLPASVNTPYGIGASQGLKITNNASTPNTKIDVSAQSALFITATGVPLWLGGALAFTIDLTTGTVTAAANGMDGEARPTNGWVYLYMVSNGSIAAGLGSTVSPTTGSAPTLPSGYTYYFYIGAMYLNGSQNLYGSRQLGPLAQYLNGGANLAQLPYLVSGTITSATLNQSTFISVPRQVLGSSFAAPLTAGKVSFVLGVNGANVLLGMAPNSSYSGFSTTNPIPLQAIDGTSQTGEFVMEGANVFVASGASAANNPIIQVLNWTDFWSK